MSEHPEKVAFLFRYGAGDHLDFLPALRPLVLKLVEEGVEVHHYGFKGRSDVPEDLEGLITVHHGNFRVNRASAWDKYFKGFLWILGLPWLGWKLSRDKVDLVFVDETLPLSAPLLRAAYKGKLLFTVHDFFMQIYWEKNPILRYPGRWVQSMDVKAWRKLDRIFTRVEAAKTHLVDQGVDPENISVVPDPVDLELFSPRKDPSVRQRFRVRYCLKETDVVMVHHGIMHPNKGNLRLVQAMGALKEACPQLKLLLIGDGPEMKDLQRMVKGMNLENSVVLTGWLPGLKDISEALQSSDIGLVMRIGLPGDHFHVTSTLVHNLACGLPVLAARLDGVSEVLEPRVAGELFDPVCGEEFRKKVIEFVENPLRRQKMGEEARLLAQECFDPEKNAAAYLRWVLEDSSH